MGNCLSWPILQSHHIKPDNVKIPGLSVNQVVTSNNRPPANRKGMENWRNYSAASTLIIFNIQELKTITDNFKTENLLGRGGFGNVYKGLIPENLRPGVQAMEVAVKVHSGEKSSQGHSEWLAEVNILGQLSHQNLVKLIGYCCENDHRVLVYEYMALGNAEYLLFSRAIDPLPWAIRMKIAYHAAKGLAFLHESEKPVIYRDFKTSNILLDMNHNAKLSDFGLAKDGPVGDDSHVSTRVMGTYGYAAPEYVKTGHLAASSDVYSFGVVLLELITGLKSLDKSRPPEQHELLNWAYPLLNQKKKLLSIIDRRLEGKYPLRSVLKTAMLAFHCLNENPKARPLMRDVVDTLEPLQEPEDIPESFKM